MFSAIEYQGKSIRLSKQAFNQMKDELNRYQMEKYPQLVHSVLPKYKGKEQAKDGLELTDTERQIKAKGRETKKEKARQLLDKAFNKANSRTDFFQHLVLLGLEVYETRGKKNGVVYQGTKMRFKRTLGFDMDERFAVLDRMEELRNLHQRSHERENGLELER